MKQHAQHRTRVGRSTDAKPDNSKSEPGPGADRKAESQTGVEVGWDPVSCWDCSTPGEPVAFFVVGLFFAAVISFCVIRARTHQEESARPKRFL